MGVEQWYRVRTFDGGRVTQRSQMEFEMGLPGRMQLDIYEKTIHDNEAQIENLKSENENNRKKITSLEHDINAASDKLTQTESDFGATYQALLSQIQDDVKNIESHL